MRGIEDISYDRCKVFYSAYLGVMHKFHIPFSGKQGVNSITPENLNQYESRHRQKLGKEPIAITTHNTSLASQMTVDGKTDNRQLMATYNSRIYPRRIESLLLANCSS